MKEETKSILKKVGEAFGLAGCTALIIGLVWAGLTFGEIEGEEKECDCTCPCCQECECEIEAE